VTVISVIGPDARAVEQVTAGVGTATARRGRRFAAGAGPGEADGVVAVVTSSEVTAEDREVVRAVRDAMGVVVVYMPESPDDPDGPAGGGVPAEPGVVHCAWGDDGYAGQRSLAGLAEVVDGMWVDRERWAADARRADADRLDRVRIAVRLAAERIATELLGTGGTGGAAGTAGAEELERVFRARLTVAVLEQGVEMPHLAAPEGAGEEEDTSVASGGTVPHLVTVAAALGAGGAAAAGVVRLTGSLAAGVVAGVLVMTATAVVRWWAGRAARREQAAARRAASLRRRWAATVTDVVARIAVPPVAEQLPGGAS
jgi:hypothetical protein